MGRRKLSLQLIPKEKSRKLTYERRKKGLMKKAQELSALCGVDTCVIMYDSGSCSDGAIAQPEIWPPNHGEVRRILERYQNKCPQTRAKRSSGLHEFFENKKRKVESELEKVRKEAWDAKYTVSDELLKSLSEDNLRDLLSSLQRKLDAAKGRLAYMNDKAKGNEDPGDSTVVFPVQSPMMGDSFGYLPHSYGMQLPQQGPVLLPGSNLGCAESGLAYVGQEARLEVGMGKEWMVLNHGVSEGKIGHSLPELSDGMLSWHPQYSHGMQIQQQGLVNLEGSNLAGVAGGFSYVEEEAEHEDGIGEQWMFLDPKASEDETGFFLPDLLDDEPSWDLQFSCDMHLPRPGFDFDLGSSSTGLMGDKSLQCQQDLMSELYGAPEPLQPFYSIASIADGMDTASPSDLLIPGWLGCSTGSESTFPL